MQHTTFQISDHWIIRRTMVQCLGDFILEGVLPPFKISNMDWFRHRFSLLLSNPTPPMRRLDIEARFCRAIAPAVSVSAAGHSQCVADPFIIDDANFEVCVEGRR
jgi:hypothetical protein